MASPATGGSVLRVAVIGASRPHAAFYMEIVATAYVTA
jgi:hypothetical protein